MMWIIASSLAMLSVAAGMALLAKTKKDELGKAFRWVSYFIVLFGFLGFACALTHGICRMSCKSGCSSEKAECRVDGRMMPCGPMGGGMMHGCGKGMHGDKMMGGDCCKKGEKMHNCSDEEEIEIDSTVIIKK